MKLKRYELEAFDKMLVDRYKQLEIELKDIKGKYKTLQLNYDVKKEQVVKFKQQLKTLKKDITHSDEYKKIKQDNQKLKNEVNALLKEIGNLIYKLNISEYE